MSNLILFIVGLAFLILIMECPVNGTAKEHKELVEKSQLTNVKINPEENQNGSKSNATRDGKQFWSILPSPPFMFVNQQAPVMHIQVPGKGRVNPAFLSPVPMARGIPTHSESAVSPLILSESDLFSKYTRSVERKVPEEILARHSGESEKSGFLVGESETILDRSGAEISGKDRVGSIMTSEEETEKMSRSNNDDLQLDETVSSVVAGISPRHASYHHAHYYTDDSADEIPIINKEKDTYPYKHAKPATDCCLFIFLDGSAFYFDDFLRKLTGYYRLMYGTVNNHPHYVSRNCKNPEEYNGSCTYIWYSGFGWVVGVGRYIGQTKGVIYTRQEDACPSGLPNWRYLNEEIEWKENGNIIVECAT